MQQTELERLLAKAGEPAEEAMRLHPFYKGKIQMALKCPVHDISDFAILYTPGVAAVCLDIHANPEMVFEHTNRGNTVVILSNGTRVLGLGNIGPKAAMPVMEGKALLFKILGGVDAVPICLDTKDPDEIVRVAKLLQPSFGGINLEDIESPNCFQILDALRADPGLQIPVWHDDQQGTATVILAGVLNALKIVGKKLGDIRIALIGTGAANVATLRLLIASGVSWGNIVACDSKGVLHLGRKDIEARQIEFVDKWRICQKSNAKERRGGIAEAMREADLCIALSKPGPGTILPEWVAGMEEDAIIFPCANPTPEIWPWEAKEAGARIVGTGRSDFPNQVNNSLGFPAIFRGVLDVRARTITDEMAIAAAQELALSAQERGINEENILPAMDEWEVFLRVAVAVGLKAQEQGVARLNFSRDQLYSMAETKIRHARDMVQFMMEKEIIPPMPAE